MTTKALRSLDDDQIKVAKHGKGPAMVVAGAGSGKTRALIQRIAYLVEQGVEPAAILATTFTRKAAGEIKDRLQLFGVPLEVRDKRKGVRVGTLHSTAFEVLQESEKFKDWETNNDFQDLLVRDLMNQMEENVADLWFEPAEDLKSADVLQFISLAKNHGRAPEDKGIFYDSWFGRGGYELYKETYLYLYRRFEEYRMQHKLITYDDMLLEAWRLLSSDGTVRRHWQDRFDYVLVDEAQDTNLVQFGIVEKLIEKHKNYMIIGDPFQSIYSWRGAYPVYMRDFTDRYPGAVVYTMGRNYRCARDVLYYATNVLEYSEDAGFGGLELTAVRDTPGDICCAMRGDEDEQASWVVQDVRRRLNRGAQHPEIAVLYRTKRVGKTIELAFDRLGVPYKRLDAVPFWERPAVKVLVYALSVVARPYWIEAGCQFLDAIKFIGPKTVSKLREAPGDTILEKAGWIAAGPRGVRVQKRQRENLDAFVEVIKACEGLPPTDVLDQITSGVNFLANFNRRKLPGDENDKDLRNDVDRVFERARDFETCEAMVAHALRLAGDSDDLRVGDRVVLSTIHRVKGLEFPHIYLVSASEGVLPLKFAIEDAACDNPDSLEEERRLFYVASTRAMESLTVVTPAARYDYGERGMVPVAPSRFLREAKLLEDEDVVREDHQEATSVH